MLYLGRPLLAQQRWFGARRRPQIYDRPTWTDIFGSHARSKLNCAEHSNASCSELRRLGSTVPTRHHVDLIMNFSRPLVTYDLPLSWVEWLTTWSSSAVWLKSQRGLSG